MNPSQTGLVGPLLFSVSHVVVFIPVLEIFRQSPTRTLSNTSLEKLP